MIKGVLNNTLLYALANQSPLFANLVLLPILTPFLTLNDYAIFGIINAYVAMLFPFNELGFNMIFQNSYFKDKNNYKSIWSNLLGLLIKWRLIYFIVLSIVLFFVLRLNDIPTNVIFLVTFLTSTPVLFFDLIKLIGTRLCLVQEQHKKIQVSAFISSIITISTSFILIYYFRLGYIAWVVSGFVTLLFQFIYFYYILSVINGIKPVFSDRLGIIFFHLKKTWPIIPHSYSSYLLNTSDRIVLDMFRVSNNQIGLYNIAYSFANYFNFLNSSLNLVLMPKLYKIFAKGGKIADLLFSALIKIWFYFTLCFAFNITIWMKELFGFLYRNSSFHSAYQYGIILIMSYSYFPIYVGAVEKTIYADRSKNVMKITLTAGLVNVLLNIIFTPLIGIWATTISTFISFMIMAFIVFYLKSFKSLRMSKFNPLVNLLLICVLTLISFNIKDFIWYQKFLISILSVLIFVLMYKFKFKKIISKLDYN
jgi:O-antigen/teichoic acid export membrane protein